MNCKPWDFALIVRTGRDTDNLAGKLVRVVRITRLGPYQAWEYEGEKMLGRTGRVVEALEDCCLRPIRDPGEDARDETLAWLPVPSTEKEAA